MLKHFFLTFLTKAINKTLALDPDAFARLKKLNGHSAKIEISNLHLSFYLDFNDTGCQLAEASEKTPDLSIAGNMGDLFKFAGQKHKTLHRSNIKITGDLGLAEELQMIFKEIDIDWEEGLSHYTGDIAAKKISDVFKQGLGFQKNLHDNLRVTSKEYFQEEINILPTKDEVDNFCQSVSKIRADIDRLSAQCERLKGAR